MNNVYLYRYEVDDEELTSAMVEGVSFKKELLETEDNYRLTVSTKGSSLKAARMMSTVNDNLYQLSVKPFKLVYDGTSEYYLTKLYPLFSELERSLKELLFIVCYASKMKDKQINILVKDIDDTSFGELLYTLKYDVAFNNSIRDYVNSKYRTKEELVEYISHENENVPWLKRIGLGTSVISLKSKYLIDLRNDIMHHHEMTYDEYAEAKVWLIRAKQELDYACYAFTQQSRENREAIANSLSTVIAQMVQTQEIVRNALNSPGLKAFLETTRNLSEYISSLFTDTDELSGKED